MSYETVYSFSSPPSGSHRPPSWEFPRFKGKSLTTFLNTSVRAAPHSQGRGGLMGTPPPTPEEGSRKYMLGWKGEHRQGTLPTT